MASPNAPERLEVLILAPVGRDAPLAAAALAAAGLKAKTCPSMGAVCAALRAEAAAVGALLLTEETLASTAESARLVGWLQGQEAWSDLPVVVLANGVQGGSALMRLLEALKPSGAVSVLERPLRQATLVTAVRAALRLRARQLQVRDLLAELERVSRAKDQFLATLSHELRTPLNAILGWTHLMGLEPENVELQRRGREVIERNARGQAQLVADLLDVSRIVSGKMRLEVGPVDLRAVVREVVEGLKPALEAKGLRLEVSHAGRAQPPLRGDAARLQQVVWNLASNAVKFTPAGGRVELTTRSGHGGVELRVADTGQGIPPELVPRVFERFLQADPSTTRGYAGLGLGLAIVKHLVELHGGTVQAQSAGLGRGATFIVRLPFAPPATAQEGQTAGAAGPGPDADPARSRRLASVSVLVVDDEPDARELLALTLSHEGARVTAAASADEALGRLSTEPLPDVLVVDVAMAGKDGHAFLRGVRASPSARVARLPAVALTAYAQEQDRRQALAAGFDLYLTKPLEPPLLIAAIQRLVLGAAAR